MQDRRRLPRTAAKIPVRFRILKEGVEVQISEPADGIIRDINLEGLALETPSVEIDGLHISYDEDPARKNRVFLQWELPSGKLIKAVGETAWYERTSIEGSSFLAGLKFREISEEDREALKEFLEISSGSGPIQV